MFYFKTRCHGTYRVPRRGGVLLVSNHQSFMDPIMATMALPRECSYMARDSLFSNPLFGWLIRSVNSFPVKRGSGDVGAIKESLRRLKQGRALLVFPEGTRTEDGQIQPMLPGLAALAKRARVPVVPVLIDGVYQAWPRDSVLPRPGDVVVEYGKPMTPDDYAGMDAAELMTELRRRLMAMQHALHRRVGRRRLQWYEPDGRPGDAVASE